MFLDKPVLGRTAVQTVSRLNRCHHGKRDVVVVDFTNNAKEILKAALIIVPAKAECRAG
jgi:type I restriction enzyme R subunit